MKIILPALLLCFLFCFPSFSQEAKKIDEIGNVNCEYYLAVMDGVINQSNNNPLNSIHVFVYEGKTLKYKGNGTDETQKIFPQYGLAKVKISSIKKYLQLRGASLDRFIFMESKFRDDFTIEFWAVPTGATPPKPTPTLTKMKYRKGKPHGFCLGCCP